MPAPLRKTYPNLDLPRAQEQVRVALQRAFDTCETRAEFTRRLNEKLKALGDYSITRVAVRWWWSEGTLLDRIYWEPIEQITDMATTRRHLRPDLYGFDQP